LAELDRDRGEIAEGAVPQIRASDVMLLLALRRSMSSLSATEDRHHRTIQVAMNVFFSQFLWTLSGLGLLCVFLMFVMMTDDGRITAAELCITFVGSGVALVPAVVSSHLSKVASVARWNCLANSDLPRGATKRHGDFKMSEDGSMSEDGNHSTGDLPSA